VYYVVLLIMAVFGLIEWLRKEKEQKLISENNNILHELL
jgi:hypothetical protein